MNIKVEGKEVDVVDKLCAKRSCFFLLQDKGTFVPGRGYTYYHKKPRWVCGRRHLNGCPTPYYCPRCCMGALELQTTCIACDGPLKPSEKLTDKPWAPTPGSRN